METGSTQGKRYAVATGKGLTRERLEDYLPTNYRVVGPVPTDLDERLGTRSFLITGEDVAGWTLDAYVIPRCGSGLITVKEVPQ